ncbi:Uma2 family endonuclease [Thiospirillum jenense]
MNMPQLANTSERFNYGDYCQWPADERWELIDGQAFAMTAPSRLHQAFVVELTRQIANALQNHPCRVYVAPFDVRLPKYDESDDRIDTVAQPDLAIICDRNKLDDKGCRGAPDWVIEILSPSSAAHDQIHKLALYERHGVREYWLLHPIDRILMIYLLGEDRRFGKPTVCELIQPTAVTVIDGLNIQWPEML